MNQHLKVIDRILQDLFDPVLYPAIHGIDDPNSHFAKPSNSFRPIAHLKPRPMSERLKAELDENRYNIKVARRRLKAIRETQP